MPRRQERYCAKLVGEALGGVTHMENHRFDFLRGDPTLSLSQGAKLPVDAYYPTHNLALEFREGQHYSDRFGFRDGRITATGDTRKEQRARYDKRREEVLPAHGIKLLVIYDYQLVNNYENDLKIVKEAIDQLLGSDTRGNLRSVNENECN